MNKRMAISVAVRAAVVSTGADSSTAAQNSRTALVSIARGRLEVRLPNGAVRNSAAAGGPTVSRWLLASSCRLRYGGLATT